MDADKQAYFDLYSEWIERKKRRPFTVYQFLKNTGFAEARFFGLFKSIHDLERQLLGACFDETMQSLTSDPVYMSYTVREKLLSFYFTLIEQMKNHRSTVKYLLKQSGSFSIFTGPWALFKSSFLKYAAELVEEGRVTGEIADRPFILSQYPASLYHQLMSVLRFWSRDESADLQDSDAVIEKHLRFSFDLMQSNGLDSLFDLSKFLIQHR
jgi:hypothetical protein